MADRDRAARTPRRIVTAPPRRCAAGRALHPRGARSVTQCLVVIALVVVAWAAGAAAAARTGASIVEVMDGDTVKVQVAGRAETLRLIGLNTPESVDPRRPVECFGRVASARMKELLPIGLRVEMEADPTQGDRDRYGRLLRYVFGPQGWNAAEVMIREGFGLEYTYRLPYRYQDAFQIAQREARENERGLWASTACGGEATAAPRAGPPPQLGLSPTPGTIPRHPPSVGVSIGDAQPCQPGQIKGNRNSGIYHAPGQQHYGRTRANVQCFDREVEAQRAGYRRAKQ